MSILPENLDYTDKDFDAIVARLNNLLTQAYPDWTDVVVSNFGNTMKEMFAFVMDVLTFYQDNQAKESRMTDVELRRLSSTSNPGFAEQPFGLIGEATQQPIRQRREQGVGGEESACEDSQLVAILDQQSREA